VSLSRGDVCLSCPGSVELGILLTHMAGVIVEETAVAAGLLILMARAKAATATCPRCGTLSGRPAVLLPSARLQVVLDHDPRHANPHPVKLRDRLPAVPDNTRDGVTSVHDGSGPAVGPGRSLGSILGRGR
jgi:hypothetical protein